MKKIAGIATIVLICVAFAIGLAVALLAGCASNAVIDMGDGRFTLTEHSVRGFQAARVNAMEKATEACSHIGGRPVVVSFEDGWEGLEFASSLIFRCG